MPERLNLVNTSCDEGHEFDAKVALELDAHRLVGTFCVSPQSAEFPLKGVFVAQRSTSSPIGSGTVVRHSATPTSCVVVLEHAGRDQK
jgi:hypothetical protein